MRLSNKIVGLDLAPFSEKVKNHWCRLWKRAVTAHTLVGVQHQRWTAMIQLFRHGHKLLSRNTVTWWPVTGGRQHHTHGTPLKFFTGTRSYAFSRSTKHVKAFLAYSQDFSKLCWRVVGTKTASRIIQLWFNYFAASFFETLGNETLIIWKFPKSVSGRTKGLRGPHAARGSRVWGAWSTTTVHNLWPYGRTRPSIMKFAAVHV